MSLSMGVIMLFQLITLPVEFDASNLAQLTRRSMGFIGTEEEIKGVRKTLDAAGWDLRRRFHHLARLLPLLLVAPAFGGRRND